MCRLTRVSWEWRSTLVGEENSRNWDAVDREGKIDERGRGFERSGEEGDNAIEGDGGPWQCQENW